MSMAEAPCALAWRAICTISSATRRGGTLLVTNSLLIADMAWPMVLREEERVVAAKVPPTAIIRAT